MNAKEFRNVLLFMCNRWNESECSMIFNGFGYLEKNYKYSLGWHIWNKWLEIIQDRGSLNGITYFFLETLDNDCLQKLINRSIEYYNK